MLLPPVLGRRMALWAFQSVVASGPLPPGLRVQSLGQTLHSRLNKDWVSALALTVAALEASPMLAASLPSITHPESATVFTVGLMSPVVNTVGAAAEFVTVIVDPAWLTAMPLPATIVSGP